MSAAVGSALSDGSNVGCRDSFSCGQAFQMRGELEPCGWPGMPRAPWGAFPEGQDAFTNLRAVVVALCEHLHLLLG